MDLFCVSEIRKPRENALEIKFFDRLEALEKLAQLSEKNDTESSIPFYQAIEQGLTAMVEIPVDPAWKDLEDEVQVIDESLPEYVKTVLIPANAAKGDDIPVSAFKEYDDGDMPTATAKASMEEMAPFRRALASAGEVSNALAPRRLSRAITRPVSSNNTLSVLLPPESIAI